MTAWREGLLARAVLAGKTRGYRHHPQLERFRAAAGPLAAIDCFLSRILDEARTRGYAFDATKIRYRRCAGKTLQVPSGQLTYEWQHLLHKLEERCPTRWHEQRDLRPRAHPCFRVVRGPIAPWERVRGLARATR